VELSAWRFWYFTWMSLTDGRIGGSQVLAMGGDFDFLAAHLWIEQNNRDPGIVTFFRELSPEQTRRYAEYTEIVAARQNPKAAAKPGLLLFPGGKKEDKPDGVQ
jgi:hypothetical protein